MGQPSSYLLGNQSQLMGADPELYRQQLIQQEQARIQGMQPQQGLAAQLGTLLGRGVTNVAQDRGFFEVTNPVLQNLQKIQNIYDTAMKEADPNDPMSFYTTLQKQFADAGLGRQALMAAQEGKKFEELGLKTEAAKTELYKNNLPLLNADIAKFREAGDDKKANQLADMLGRFQVKENNAAAMQTAELALKQAQTAAQKASAANQLAQIESGKTDWKAFSEYEGGPTVAYAIKDKTGKIRYEKIGGGEYIPKEPKGKETSTKGEKVVKDDAWFSNFFTGNTPNAAKPVATPAPVVPGQAANSNTPNPLAANGEYRAVYDPTFLGIQQAIAQDPTRLAADPEFMAAITKARNDRVEQLRKQYGNMVNFTGVL